MGGGSWTRPCGTRMWLFDPLVSVSSDGTTTTSCRLHSDIIGHSVRSKMLLAKEYPTLSLFSTLHSPSSLPPHVPRPARTRDGRSRELRGLRTTHCRQTARHGFRDCANPAWLTLLTPKLFGYVAWTILTFKYSIMSYRCRIF